MSKNSHNRTTQQNSHRESHEQDLITKKCIAMNTNNYLLQGLSNETLNNRRGILRKNYCCKAEG